MRQEEKPNHSLQLLARKLRHSSNNRILGTVVCCVPQLALTWISLNLELKTHASHNSGSVSHLERQGGIVCHCQHKLRDSLQRACSPIYTSKRLRLSDRVVSDAHNEPCHTSRVYSVFVHPAVFNELCLRRFQKLSRGSVCVTNRIKSTNNIY